MSVIGGGDQWIRDVPQHSPRITQAEPLPSPPEEQDVAVRVRNLEAAQAIVRIFKRRSECCAPIREFGGKRIRVCCIDEGIPPYRGTTLWVRQRRRVFIGLDEDLRSVAADDGEKGIPLRLLESHLKAKLVAVKSDGLIDIADNEEGRNRLRRWSCHKREASCAGILRSSIPIGP